MLALTSRLRRTSIAALLVVATAPAVAQQQRVGVDSAVNEQATGTAPGAPTQPLVIGQDVVFNERVATGSAGQAQLLFLDKSAMSIGPDSDLTIDQFAYDPASGTGKIAMSTSRGVLRFVGGAVSKQEDAVSLHTSLATIAVRGGAFLTELIPGRELNVYFIYGKEITVTGANGVVKTMRRPGFVVTVRVPDPSPSAPYIAAPEVVAALLAKLDGRRGGSGGASRPPTDQRIAASGIDNTISGNVAATLAAAADTRGPLYLPDPINPANIAAYLRVNSAIGHEALSESMTGH